MRCLLVLTLVACGEARSTDGGTSSVSASVSASASVVSSARPVASSSTPIASAPVASASAPPPGGRAIAAWLDETEANRPGARSFAIEGVYQRTWLYQSGAYIGDEHPGIRVFVVNVADAPNAAARDTLQCWTSLLSAPTDLVEGDRVRVEGEISYLTGHASRRYLPHLYPCKYTRL